MPERMCEATHKRSDVMYVTLINTEVDEASDDTGKGKKKHTFYSALKSIGRLTNKKTLSSCDNMTDVSSTTAATSSSSKDMNTATARRTSKKRAATNNNVVSFSSFAQGVYTISHHEMTEMEKQSTWYTREEYNEINRRCSKQIAMMESGKVLKDKKYCSRGLESHTRILNRLKKQNREAAYVAVLDNIATVANRWGDDHTIPENDDDEWIAQQYRNVSSSCQLWAHTVGLQDQKEAEDYYHLDDIMDEATAPQFDLKSHLHEAIAIVDGNDESHRTKSTALVDGDDKKDITASPPHKISSTIFLPLQAPPSPSPAVMASMTIKQRRVSNSAA